MENDNKKSAEVQRGELVMNGSTSVPPQFQPPTSNESLVNAFTPYSPPKVADHQMTANSVPTVSTPFTPHLPHPTPPLTIQE